MRWGTWCRDHSSAFAETRGVCTVLECGSRSGPLTKYSVSRNAMIVHHDRLMTSWAPVFTLR